METLQGCFARIMGQWGQDELPVKVPPYQILESEMPAEAFDIAITNLKYREFPENVQIPIALEVQKKVSLKDLSFLHLKADSALASIYQSETPPCKVYDSFSFMKFVVSETRTVCLKILETLSGADVSRIVNPFVPVPSYVRPSSVCAIKNTRRKMEDRHVVLHDCYSLCASDYSKHEHLALALKDKPLQYYAVFDGHAGQEAATYCASHLHWNILRSSNFPDDLESAFRDAFHQTDIDFERKASFESFKAGATAVCCLISSDCAYIAWLGDSQAGIVRKEDAIMVVDPHKPDREDERQRIEDEGGCVIFWGTWRINGELAVSRAIGDRDFKPFVSAKPDIEKVPLDGTEDFMIVACDGLWDKLTMAEAADFIRAQLVKEPGISTLRGTLSVLESS